VNLLKQYHQRTIILFLALVIVLGIWSFHTFQQSMETLRERVLQQQRVLAIQAANGIDTHLHWLEMELTRLSLASEWRKPDTSSWHLKLGEVLAYGRRVQINDVQLIGQDGTLLASAKSPYLEGQSQAKQSYFQRASELNSDRTLYEITTYHTGREWEKGLIMARPIHISGREFGGVILFSLGLSGLLDKFLPNPSETSESIWLADEQGQIYQHSHPLGYPISSLFADSHAYLKLLKDARTGLNSSTDLEDTEGLNQIVSVLPLKMAAQTWTVVVSTRGSEIADQTKHIFIDFLLFFFIAGGVSLINLFFHTRIFAEAHATLEEEVRVRKKLQERMKHLAQHDSLTGLPNRRLFFDRLSQALTRSHREGNRAAILFLDLDHFKPINDTLGHNVGDGLLKQVAQTMQHCVRESDTIARLGGDEFGIILSDLSDGEEAAMVARKIILALTTPFEVLDQECQIGTSIGIAIYPEHGTEPNRLLQQADSAMYRAKSLGRNQFELFQSEFEQAESDPSI
jgi:diguanylate cyclase (GGDEF)-like protein